MELALLTGEVGSGKTLLTRALVDRVGERYEIGMILNPRLPPRQFLPRWPRSWASRSRASTSNELLDQIHERLLALDEAGRPALLIVDEAHLIPGSATFEEIRLLTNFQLDDRNLIAVVLVGQPELRARLATAGLPAADPAHRRRLPPAPARRRGGRGLRAPPAAGGRRPRPTSSATARSRACTRPRAGIPRVLNHLATQALLEAMARGLAAGGRGVGVGRGRAEPGASARVDLAGAACVGGGRADGADDRRPQAGAREGQRRGAEPARAAGASRHASPTTQRWVARDEPHGLSGGPACPRPRRRAIALPSVRPGRRHPGHGGRGGGVRRADPGLRSAPRDARAGPRRGAAPTTSRSSPRPCARSARRRRRPSTSPPSSSSREEYGVDVRLVQEIIRVSEITPVPRAPESIKGVINLRGRIIPVIDLKRKLGLGDVERRTGARASWW